MISPVTRFRRSPQQERWTRGEVYAGGRHVATYSGGTGGTTYFNHADWLGTERARSNVSGALCESITSLPFGDAMTTSGSCGDPSPMHFTGKERDSESNLDNFGARYDSSSTGSFMSPDPLGGHLENPQSLNKYAYVLNNPLRLTDPTGLDSYLQCQNSDHSGCGQETVGYDKNGKAQTAWVQGVTNADKSFTATLIGNANPDGSGGLVDKTTGTGAYTASVNGNGVQFSNNGGQSSSTGVYLNGSPNNISKTLALPMAAHSPASPSLSQIASWRRTRPRREHSRSMAHRIKRVLRCCEQVLIITALEKTRECMSIAVQAISSREPTPGISTFMR